MTINESMASAHTGLMDALTQLRRQTRADRRASWLPLILFGLIETGSAFLYWGESPPSALMDGYLLLAAAVGLALTVWWYRRRGRDVGVSTPTRGAALAFAGTSVILLTIGGLLMFRGTDWLLVVAVALLALAWAERSALLGVIAALNTAAAGLGVLYNPENILFRVLGRLGVAPEDQPYQVGSAVNVLLPGAVLLLGAIVTLMLSRRVLSRRVLSRRRAA